MFERHILEDEAGGDVAAGGGDAPGGDGAAAPALGGFASAAAASAGVEGEQGVVAEGAADQPGEDGRPAWLEAKFWDPEKKEARFEDLSKSYREAQTRLKGAIAMPPKEATGYEFELAEGEEFPIDEALDGAFRDFAIELGLNNKQYNAIYREHAKGLAESRDGYWFGNEAKTHTDLVAQHGTETAAAKIKGDAWRTVSEFCTPEEQAAIQKAPSSAVVMNLLARISGELRPDRAPQEAGAGSSFETQTQQAIALRRDTKGAYWNDRAPGHVAAVQQVAAWEAECARRGVSSIELTRNN